MDVERGRWPTIRGHIVAGSVELIGTTLFLFIAFAVHIMAAKQSGNHVKHGLDSETIVFISLGYGFSLLVNVWIFYRVSGGQFNPAVRSKLFHHGEPSSQADPVPQVTLCLMLTAALPWPRGLVLIPVQIAGGILAALLAQTLLGQPISLVNTGLSDGINAIQGLFIEAILTLLLLMTVLMLAAEKSKATFLAPVGIGLTLFIAELAGINFTGASLNPARSFGPAVVSGRIESDHWVYWAGPLLGTGLSSLLYGYLKAMKYVEANPGQDHDAEEVGIGSERA